jgi:quercetin dioxygenase-like cupin family protein
MAIPHAKSGDVIDVQPLASRLKQSVTSTLVKTDALEVLRLVVPAGTSIDRHQVPGEITVQCLEGQVIIDSGGADRELMAGNMLYLEGGTPHALRAVEDSSVLVTILIQHKGPANGAQDSSTADL